jgi:Flp pilus assembly secretin CpaC
MFPSRYLKAADFEGKPVSLTIAEVFRDNVQMANGSKADRYIVRFRETDKELILNKTNAKAVAKVLAEPKAVHWAGEKIILKPAKCEAFGEIVDCIRVETREAV